MNRLHTTSRDGISEWCLLLTVALVCVGCTAESTDSDSVTTTHASRLPETTQAGRAEISLDGVTIVTIDGASQAASDDVSVAGTGSSADSSAMPIDITRYYNSRCPIMASVQMMPNPHASPRMAVCDAPSGMSSGSMRPFDLGPGSGMIPNDQFRARNCCRNRLPIERRDRSLGGALHTQRSHAFCKRDPLIRWRRNPDRPPSTVMDEREPIPEFSTIYPQVELIAPDQWAQQSDDVADNMQKLIGSPMKTKTTSRTMAMRAFRMCRGSCRPMQQSSVMHVVLTLRKPTTSGSRDRWNSGEDHECGCDQYQTENQMVQSLRL